MTYSEGPSGPWLDWYRSHLLTGLSAMPTGLQGCLMTYCP